MKVARDTHVLSGSECLALLSLVYAKELPDSPRSTAYFCDRMDKLFDCLNSCCPKKTEQKLRYAIGKGKSELIEFLEQQIPWIAAWKFEGRSQPHTIIGWQITIKAILLLWEDISQNFDFEFLLTRRLQQDPLENMLGHIRQKQGCNMNPNVSQFVSGLKHIGIHKPFTLQIRGMWRMMGQTSFRSSRHFLFVSHHLQTLWKLSLQTTFLLWTTSLNWGHTRVPMLLTTLPLIMSLDFSSNCSLIRLQTAVVVASCLGTKRIPSKGPTSILQCSKAH